MYNLANLNDEELEMLAKDIMQVKLEIPLQRFPKGRDSGIDICDVTLNPKVVIQVKHYINSKWHDLKTSLKKEVIKVDKIKPKQYYVFTSLKLTLKQKQEIFKLFNSHMKDISNIVSGIEICEFLNDDKNEKILKNNFKLWFSSVDFLTKLQNQHVEIDSRALIEEIQEEVKLFVQTKSYFDCLNKLEEKNTLIITGSPGVGKSMISKMVVLYYIAKDYRLRYVSDQNVKDIKKTISLNPEVKEIILLDDFLGQHYFDMDEKIPNEIKSLVALVNNSKTKKMILNSRATILNEAAERNLYIKQLLTKSTINQYVVNLDDMSHMEKAKILYNHLYFSEIPHDYFGVVKKDKVYEYIIKHKNYNPRIIDFLTNPSITSNVKIENYVDTIKKNLDNPSQVWQDEFMYKLSEEDRIFMHTLYSMTNHRIPLEHLRKAYDRRIKNSGIKSTLNIFEKVHKRLSDSMVKNYVDINSKGESIQLISTLNPSVNDYINEVLKTNILEKESIVNNAVFIEQIDKVMRISEPNAKQFFSHDEINLESYYDETAEYYLKHILKFNIKNMGYSENVEQAFYETCISNSYMKEEIITGFIKTGLVSYYSLEPLLEGNISEALETLSLEAIEIVYEFLNDYHMTYENYEIFKDITIEKLKMIVLI